MTNLDPDDPRPPYQQIAAELRAAIKTGEYGPGDKLPSGPDLTKRYGVAKMTVDRALAVLREEGLTVSRQGSGVFVRSRTERPVGLRPYIERAFEAEQVSIDFAGFSGETLFGVMSEPLDKIRAGRLTPTSVRVRLMVPDTNAAWSLPCRSDDLSDDPDFRERAANITNRSLGAILDGVQELADLGLVADASAEVRIHRLAPLFKLYVINETDVFFGFYPVVPRTIKIKGDDHPVYDLMGKDATLFHFAIQEDGGSVEPAYIAQARAWFDSVWTTIAREYGPA